MSDGSTGQEFKGLRALHQLAIGIDKSAGENSAQILLPTLVSIIARKYR
jgi:hypothetical protein